MEIFTRVLFKYFQKSKPDIEFLQLKEQKGISWIIWKIGNSEQRKKLLHNIMVLHVKWMKTKAKTIVCANVNLQLRKCNCQSFCENSALLFKLLDIWNMVLTKKFLVNKKRNPMVPWWLRKLSLIFDLKKTPSNVCQPNFPRSFSFQMFSLFLWSKVC